MSVSTQTIQSLDQFTKQLYADKVQDLVPDFELLMKGIPFVSAEKQAGGDYVQPVILSRDHGVTFHGKNDAQLKLEAPIAAIIDSASIRPSAMTMRAMLSYTSASRLTGGPRAFVNGTSYIVESLVQSFAAIMEQIHWYGGMGLGRVKAANGLSGNVIEIDAKEWASGVWVGGEGMLVELFSVDGNGNPTSKVLTTEISQVDIINKKLTLASVSGLSNNTVYVIFRKGSYGLESLGAHYILQNQGSLFGIDAAQRKLWEANRYDCGAAALSFEKVSEGIAKAYGRGLLGKMKLYVSPVTFSTMFPDFKTVKASTNFFPGRIFNDEDQVKTLEHGVNAIKFFINSVEVEVIASPYVKEGYAFGLSDEGWVRVGSRDLSLGTPGMPEGSYWMQAQDYSALELRAFTDQALFCTKPARQILFTNISNA